MSYKMDNKNFELQLLEKQILKKRQKIPYCKRKIFDCFLPLEDVCPISISNLNSVVKQYPNAYFECIDWQGTSIIKSQLIPIKNNISESYIKTLKSQYSSVVLKFDIEANGLSERLIDKIRPSNWFLKDRLRRPLGFSNSCCKFMIY